MLISTPDAQGLSALAPRIAAILNDYPHVAAAWVFGSMARGSGGPDSDVDLGLLARERGHTALDLYRQIAEIASRMEGLVGGRRVDVVLLEPQGPVFCHAVLREGRLVYDADPERRIDFESDTFVRYFDFLPTYQIAAGHAVHGMRDWLSKHE